MIQSSSGLLSALIISAGDVDRSVDAIERAAGSLVDVRAALSVADATVTLGGGTVDIVLVDLADAPPAPGEMTRLASVTAEMAVIVVDRSGAGEAWVAEALEAGGDDWFVVVDDKASSLARSLRFAIGRRRAAEKQNLAERYDGLTGLSNRTHFQTKLERRLKDAPERSGALLVVNLDRFAIISQGRGRAVGDRILQSVAERLRSLSKPGDLVARLGGDSFVVWIDHLTLLEEAAMICRRSLDALNRPFVIDGARISISATAGISVFPFDAGDFSALLNRADAAMHRAKEEGGDVYALYDERMLRCSAAKLQRRSSLREHLDTEAFELRYEPQIDLRTGRARGAKVVVRDPEAGLTPAALFASEDDLSVPLAQWTLLQAALQVAAWLRADAPLVPLTVPLPLRLLRRNDAVETIRRQLRTAGCHPAWFELAVVHSGSELRADSAVVERLQTIRDLGFRLSLADFGTHPGSLNLLRFVPADAVEIGPDFAARVPQDRNDLVLLTSLAELVRGIGVEPGLAGVASGPTTAAIRDTGCEWISGPWVSPLLDADEFLAWLEVRTEALCVAS